MPGCDKFKLKPEALTAAIAASDAGQTPAQIRAMLISDHGITLTKEALRDRLNRIAAKRAVAAAEARSKAVSQATTALAQSPGNQHWGRRRKFLLDRAEQIWRELPPKVRRSWKFYIDLENLALKYLVLQLKVAKLVGEGDDTLKDIDAVLKTKIAAMMARAGGAATPAQEGGGDDGAS